MSLIKSCGVQREIFNILKKEFTSTEFYEKKVIQERYKAA